MVSQIPPNHPSRPGQRAETTDRDEEDDLLTWADTRKDEVELSGLEPLTPCLQIAVIMQELQRELACGPPVSDRGIPLLTGVIDTLMARRSHPAVWAFLLTVSRLAAAQRRFR
jgi:hypothetical protein